MKFNDLQETKRCEGLYETTAEQLFQATLIWMKKSFSGVYCSVYCLHVTPVRPTKSKSAQERAERQSPSSELD